MWWTKATAGTETKGDTLQLESPQQFNPRVSQGDQEGLGGSGRPTHTRAGPGGGVRWKLLSPPSPTGKVGGKRRGRAEESAPIPATSFSATSSPCYPGGEKNQTAVGPLSTPTSGDPVARTPRPLQPGGKGEPCRPSSPATHQPTTSTVLLGSYSSLPSLVSSPCGKKKELARPRALRRSSSSRRRQRGRARAGALPEPRRLVRSPPASARSHARTLLLPTLLLTHGTVVALP